MAENIAASQLLTLFFEEQTLLLFSLEESNIGGNNSILSPSVASSFSSGGLVSFAGDMEQ